MTGHNLVPNQMDGFDDSERFRTMNWNFSSVADNKEFGWRGTKFKCEDQKLTSDDDLCLLTANSFSDADDQEFGWRGVKFKSVL